MSLELEYRESHSLDVPSPLSTIPTATILADVASRIVKTTTVSKKMLSADLRDPL